MTAALELQNANMTCGLLLTPLGPSADKAEVKAALEDMVDVGLHKNGDYILDDSAEVDIKKK